MPIRFKVDEDLPREVGEVLRAAGHDASTVVEQHLCGAPDPELWRRVQAEDRCLVTADKGFADVRKFPPGSHAGIILLRLRRETRAGYIDLVQLLLRRSKIDGFRGAIVTVSPEAIRWRHSP